MPKTGTLALALVVAAAFGSHAEAHDFHGDHGFYQSPFFRDQGRPHLSHCEEQRQLQMEQAYAQDRAERLQAMRAGRAAEARKRARWAAIQQQKAGDAEQQQQNATRQDRNAQQTPAPQGTTAPVSNATTASKNDKQQQPVATETSAPAQTAAVTQSDVCRKYSAAADGLVDVPCN